jgi:hypothetical protein
MHSLQNEKGISASEFQVEESPLEEIIEAINCVITRFK